MPLVSCKSWQLIPDPPLPGSQISIAGHGPPAAHSPMPAVQPLQPMGDRAEDHPDHPFYMLRLRCGLCKRPQRESDREGLSPVLSGMPERGARGHRLLQPVGAGDRSAQCHSTDEVALKIGRHNPCWLNKKPQVEIGRRMRVRDLNVGSPPPRHQIAGRFNDSCCGEPVAMHIGATRCTLGPT
jgi:hypothetical protein